MMTKKEILESYLRWRLDAGLNGALSEDIADVVLGFERDKLRLDKVVKDYKKERSEDGVD